MADSKNFEKRKIQDTNGSGFGSYSEGVGGGASPHGKSAPSDHGHGVNSDYRQANNDTMQPRTGDGKFTYKSVNGQSIDPKYGPSRGETVNPLLTGGKNGVKIDDVKQQFYNQQGAYWDQYKDSWCRKGSMVVTAGDFKVRVSSEDIWDVAKHRYDKNKGEFEGESSMFNETKKGRHSLEEKSAIQKAKSSGEEQGVIDQSTGALKLKPGVVPQAPQPKPQPVPGAGAGSTPVVPGGGNGAQPPVSVNAASASDIANADYTPKYGDDDIAQARAILQQAGLSDSDLSDFDNLSPKEKDAYIDKYFSESDDEADTTQMPDQTAPEADATPEADASEGKQESKTEGKGKPEEKEEDSEAIKKIKKMGFSD